MRKQRDTSVRSEFYDKSANELRRIMQEAEVALKEKEQEEERQRLQDVARQNAAARRAVSENMKVLLDHHERYGDRYKEFRLTDKIAELDPRALPRVSRSLRQLCGEEVSS